MLFRALKSRSVVIDVGGGDAPSNVDEKLIKKVASVIEGETAPVVRHASTLRNAACIRAWCRSKALLHFR